MIAHVTTAVPRSSCRWELIGTGRVAFSSIKGEIFPPRRAAPFSGLMRPLVGTLENPRNTCTRKKENVVSLSQSMEIPTLIETLLAAGEGRREKGAAAARGGKKEK